MMKTDGIRCVGRSIVFVAGWMLTTTAASAQDLSPTELHAAGLEIRWTAQAMLNTSRDKVRYFSNDEELVYIQSSAGIVTAFNAEDGRRMWASQVGQNDDASMEAVSNKNTLLITSGPVINGLDKFSGDELFEYRLRSPPTASPGINDGMFFVPMTDGSVGAFSIWTLQYKEKLGKLPPGVSQPLDWRYVAGERLRFSPVAGSETVSIASDAGNLHAVNTSSINRGKALYQLLLDSPISAQPTYVRRGDDEFVLAASKDNRLFCIGLTKGAKMVWTYPMGDSITEPMAAIGDTVFVITNGGGLTAFSLAGGTPLDAEGKIWNVSNISALAAVSAKRVYAIDTTQRLLVIDRANAKVLHRIPATAHHITIRNDATDRILVSTASGNVMSIVESGSDFAIYHQNPDRQPVVPGVSDKDEAPAADGAAPASATENGNAAANP